MSGPGVYIDSTKNSPNSGIDTTGTVDPKDQTTTYYDTNEKLLLFLY